jgi:hypothetical protein
VTLRRAYIHTAPPTAKAMANNCAVVNGPKNRSSLARKNSMMNR